MNGILTPEFVTSTGFPIAMVIYLLYERRKQDTIIWGMLENNITCKYCEVENDEG